MRTAKSYENYWYTADELKSKSSNVKRLLGGLKNIDKDKLEMDEKELKQLAAAISLVSKIGEHYAEASRIKRRVERAEAVESEKIRKLISLSGFAKLTSVADKVAFISHGKFVHMFPTSDQDTWGAKHCMTRTYEDALGDMNYSVAAEAKRSSKTAQEALDGLWVAFQSTLPERHKRYAGLIERIEKLLAMDADKV